MKIIRTARYNDLPGSPDFPPGVSQRDVDENARDIVGSDDMYGQQGFFETNINWDALMESHLSLGYDVTPAMDAIDGEVEIEIYYTFDYIQDAMYGYTPTNIKVTQANLKTRMGNVAVDDEDLLYRLKEDFEDKIRNDIKQDASHLELP